MKQPSKQCQQHQQECIALDRNPKCDPNRRDLCAKCLTTQMRHAKIQLYQDAASELQDIKQEFKRKLENQSKRNIEILKEFRASVYELANHFSQTSDKLSQNINQQIAHIEAEVEKMDQKLETIGLDEYFSSGQASIEQSDQYIQIKQTLQLQFDKLLKTDNLQKCQSKIKQIDDQVLTLTSDWEFKSYDIEEETDTPHLQLICEEHKKEIILFDLSANKPLENRLVCVHCISGSQGTFTAINDVKKLWEDQEKNEYSQLKMTEKQMKNKYTIIFDTLTAFKKKITNKLNEVIPHLSKKLQDMQKAKLDKKAQINRDWLKLTKQDALMIADVLSQPNPNEFLKSGIDQHFQQTDFYLYNSVLNLSDSVIKCFETINKMVNFSQIENEDAITQTIAIVEKNYHQLKIGNNKLDENFVCKSTQSIIDFVLEGYRFVLLKLIQENQNPFFQITFDSKAQIFFFSLRDGIIACEIQSYLFSPIQFIENKLVTVLYFLNKKNQLVSGNNEGYIHVWGKKSRKNRLNWFYELQKIQAHGNAVNCVIAKEDEDLMISCSDDKTIKFWINKDNKWQQVQTIEGHKDKVFAISLNEQQNQLVSCGNDKQILVMQQDKEKKWSIVQSIKGFGFRICFIGDTFIAFQPVNGKKMKLYKFYSVSKQFQEWKDIRVQKGKQCSIYSSQMLYNKEKQVLININGRRVNIIGINDSDIRIKQTMSLNWHQTVSIQCAFSKGGNQLAICDTASFEIRLLEIEE